MIRWIAVIATLLLAGCVTTREYVYRDGYQDNDYSDSRYYADGRGDGYYDDRRRHSGGSYYSPSYSGRGDYYYGRPDYYAGYPSWYVDYPAYYSLFWGLNRSWYDPYSYPNYYYGVTYYPRNYFSISFGSGWGGSRYGYQYYSPYRYSWVDNYYDWSPWHHHHSRDRYYRPSPRYGSALNEAERLSRLSDSRHYANPRGDSGASYGGRHDTVFDQYGSARGGLRGADYDGRAAPRQDPGARGFGVPTEGGYGRGDVRRNASYGAGVPRQDPGTRGFGVPVEGGNATRGADYGGATPSRGELPSQSGYGRDPGTDAQREIGRYGDGSLPGYGRGSRDASGEVAPMPSRTNPRRYSGDNAGMEGEPAPSYQRFERAPRQRDYDAGVAMPRSNSNFERSHERAPPAAVSRGYDAGGPSERVYRQPPRETFREPMPEAREYAPAPEVSSYASPSRGYDAGPAAREPSYSAPSPEPRYESRPNSDSDSGDQVRRVGSNRDE